MRNGYQRSKKVLISENKEKVKNPTFQKRGWGSHGFGVTGSAAKFESNLQSLMA
jgi:hypothetical protein